MAYKKVISKYGVGTYWKHRKHKFIIKVTNIRPFSSREVQLVWGEPDAGFELRLKLIPNYSTDTLRANYEPIDPKTVKILYGKSDVNK